MNGSGDTPAPPTPEPADPGATHLRVGWWSLLVFLALGSVLEGLHGFKVGWYLDVTNEMRRLMLSLAHAHGTLFAVLNIAFGLTVRALPDWQGGARRLASRCLLAALILLPAGFVLGGLFIHGGDPGLGVLLVPTGALMLLVAVFLTARATDRWAGAGNRRSR